MALTRDELIQIRRSQTMRSSKYGLGGQLKRQAPAPVTLRRSEYEAKRHVESDTPAPSGDVVSVASKPPRSAGRPWGSVQEGRQARGNRDGNHVKLVCAIDPDTFDQIRNRAVAAKTSVAQQIRELIEWGLEAERR